MAKSPINLLRGWPSPSLLPASLIKAAAINILSSSDTSTPALLYGPDPGYEPLRSSLAHWLTNFYSPTAGAIPSSRLCITGGASQNLGNILAVYTDPVFTRHIWLVAPAYFLAFRVFEDAGFAGRMRGVRETEEGVDLEALAREMERSEERLSRDVRASPFKPVRKRAKVYQHLIYCVPTFANPSSRTMSLQCRQGLVRLARRFDALVVCDDVYDFLQWPAEEHEGREVLQTAHLPRLVDLDRELDGGAETRDGGDGFGNVCSNGSFSKIAGPGLRVGWVEGTEKFAYGISQTGTTASGGAPSQLTSTYMHHLVSTNALQTHIQHTLLPAYAVRYTTLLDAITSFLLPLGFSLPQTGREVVGGYFAWLGLPASLDSENFARRCQRDEGVIIAPGRLFEVPGESVDGDGGFARFVRLCWAWEEVDALSEGPRRMALVARRMLQESRQHQQEQVEGYVVVEGVGETSDGDGLDEFK